MVTFDLYTGFGLIRDWSTSTLIVFLVNKLASETQQLSNLEKKKTLEMQS